MQKHVKPDTLERSDRLHAEALLDEALNETFPASDPPAMISGIDGVKAGVAPRQKPRIIAPAK